ncbi:hypothetical protein RB195_016150 [Necator americanus]|uniref:Uncharacterized protein n=1 Tax=Necator americanus TaxID=51031 RepID=A0ABR1E878_NECAM
MIVIITCITCAPVVLERAPLILPFALIARKCSPVASLLAKDSKIVVAFFERLRKEVSINFSAELSQRQQDPDIFLKELLNSAKASARISGFRQCFLVFNAVDP